MFFLIDADDNAYENIHIRRRAFWYVFI